MYSYFEKLDKRWDELPIQKQHHYTLYFFAGYLLLTLVVISKVCYDTLKSNNTMTIKHILNPVLENKETPAPLQDTLQPTLKNKTYESK